jgi:hypothetical protein
MSSPVFFLVYVSSATELMPSEEVVRLLSVCHQNNSKNGITGMLLHRDGNFMQMIEGDEASVRKLLDKISQDSRHKNLIVLLEGTTQERQFPDWTMGFKELNSQKVRDLPGFSEFLNTPLNSGEFRSNPSVAQKLLLSFKKHTR